MITTATNSTLEKVSQDVNSLHDLRFECHQTLHPESNLTVPGHRPLAADEMIAWAGYDKIKSWEHEQAMKKAKSRKR